MSATNADLKKQVDRMIAFMEQEGKEREDEILSKAEEDYNILIADMVYAGRLKVKELYEKKEAAVVKQRVVATSIASHQRRLWTLKIQDDIVTDVIEELYKRIKDEIRNKSFYLGLLSQLLLQGLTKMLEPVVGLRVMKRDLRKVESILDYVAAEYKRMTTLPITFEVDHDVFLPDCCAGGVVIFARQGSIMLENTVLSRLRLISNSAMPLIKELLFAKHGMPDESDEQHLFH